MPWILRVILTLFPLLLFAYGYTGWKLHESLNRVLTLPRIELKWYFFAGIGYLNLHPVLLLGSYFLGFENLIKNLRGGQRLWDLLFTYPFWFGIILVGEMLPWLLAMDFLKLPFFPFYKAFRSTWLDVQARVTLGMMLLLTLYIFVRVYLDTNRVRVSEIQLAVPGLPKTLEGFKIAHISDLQADPRTRTRKMKRYVSKVNRLRPDVIFFTGDLVTSGEDYIDLGARMLGALEARYGVYACLGDHDYWANARRIAQTLNRDGIVTVENANRFVRVGFDSLLVTFVTNVYSKRPSLDQLNLLMGTQPRGAVDIVLTHQPSEELIEIAAERGYHLLLAGHSHGGQIVFRPLGLKFTLARFENRYYTGFHFVDRMLVSVNNGLGLTFAPFRYRAPAEITLIHLTPE